MNTIYLNYDPGVFICFSNSMVVMKGDSTKVLDDNDIFILKVEDRFHNALDISTKYMDGSTWFVRNRDSDFYIVEELL